MLERVNDLITYRIDATLDEIANMCLCDLTDEDVITPEDFYKHVQELCAHASRQIQTKSQNVKDSVFEMVDLLCGDIQAMNNTEESSMENTLTSQDFDPDEFDG